MNDMVSNNAAQHRFELAVDGHIAAAYYESAGDVITFEHTEVPAELGGKGIGSKLVKGALDQVRADGLKVVAQCPFVKGWIGNIPIMPACSRPDASICAAPSRCRLSRAVEVGAKLQRLPEIRDRALLVAEPQFGLAAVVPGVDVGRIVLQRLVVVGDARPCCRPGRGGSCRGCASRARRSARA